MPKYLKNKRRRRHHGIGFKDTETIEMKPSAKKKEKVRTEKEKTSFRILVGKRKANRIKKIILASAFIALALTLLIVSLSSPTGIGESITNFTSTFSFGSQLPVELSSTETFAVSAKNNYCYLLSDTELSVYSNNGKKSFSDTHGLSSPVLCESDARCLIYDQNGTGVRIYNAKKLILTKDNKNKIYACDISRDGTFAVAGKSENYASMVTVYDKNGDMLYEWYSPQEIITAVAVSPNGKSIALTTISIINGMYNSKLYAFNYESANPIFTKEYSGEFIYGINSVSKKTFSVFTENTCDIISWKDYSLENFTSDYSINAVKANKKQTVILSSRENNDGNALFSVYNKKKVLITSFNFSGTVDDFMIHGKNIFVLSGNTVYLVDSQGKVVKTGECGFGVVKIVPVSSSSCLAISHNSITKISMQ